MQFNLNQDYKRPEGISKELSNSEVTVNYIEFAVNQIYNTGLQGSQRRIFARIQRKMDEAIDKKEEVIDLEQAEFDFIYDIFKNDKLVYGSSLAKYVVVLEDYIMSLKVIS